LAAYNLEYRLGGGGAPDWARDRLLSVYQGTVNDNVMKLVHFKRVVDSLEGRTIVMLGAASFAEALYPHVAFRPVEALELWVPEGDVAGFSGFLAEGGFKPQAAREGERGAAAVLSDGRTEIFLRKKLLGDAELDKSVFARALPLKAYGPSFYRLDLEDAVLSLCLDHARSGYRFPVISLLDLRELLLGAPELGGSYSRPPDFQAIRERARTWRLERALYASTAVMERLFPQTASQVTRVRPALRPSTRALLDRWVVAPLTTLGKLRGVRGADRLRRLLTGGRERV
jgi:hypothetical protein